MSTTSITYGDEFLTIKIRTASPATMHHLLLRGLISSLKNQILIPDRNNDDIDGLVTLAEVLAKVVPTELHLVKAYQQNPAA